MNENIWGWLIWFAIGMLIMLLLTGCGSVPSMKYCDTVWYSREKEKVHIEADCTVPVGAIRML